VSVVRHVVLLTWADHATTAQRDEAERRIRELPRLVPAIRRYRVGTDAGIDAGNADLAIVADFDDPAGYEAYRDHPAHRAVIAEAVRPIVAARTAVQHDLPDE